MSDLIVQPGQLIKTGTILAPGLNSPYTGQILKILPGQILVRLGRPYLVSSGTIVHLKKGSLVRQSDTLATLIYEKVKTTDIVQGLPKVEELLEARKIKRTALLAPCSGYFYLRLKDRLIEIYETPNDVKKIEVSNDIRVRFQNGSFVKVGEPLTDGVVSPHNKVATLFNYYKTKYSTLQACKISLKILQLFLVNEIQKTYLAQGVQIADKHLEVIVRQMTSKICVEKSGTTTFLPGEILDFRRMETIVQIAQANNEVPPVYSPTLLGITKAALNSDSFISAASFQETTRVLTDAAVEGKRDWLNGLKENVIIGRLIPAGTGFSYAKNCAMVNREHEDLARFFPTPSISIKTKLLESYGSE